MNIQAGNGYFGKKKEKYKSSLVEEVLGLSRYHKDDWAKDDIELREDKFLDDVLRFVHGHIANVATPS